MRSCNTYIQIQVRALLITTLTNIPLVESKVQENAPLNRRPTGVIAEWGARHDAELAPQVQGWTIGALPREL